MRVKIRDLRAGDQFQLTNDDTCFTLDHLRMTKEKVILICDSQDPHTGLQFKDMEVPVSSLEEECIIFNKYSDE